MLRQLRRKALVARLTIGLVCPWLMAGCAMWSDVSDRIQASAPISDAGMDRFVGELRPLQGDAESILDLGMHYQKRGRYHWAIGEFKKVLAIDPQHVRAYNAIGVTLDNLEKYAAAQKAYRRALEIDDQLDYVWNNLGYSAMLQGHPEEAVAYFQKALSLNDDNRRYRNNLLMARAQLPVDAPPGTAETSRPAAAEKTTPPTNSASQDQITPEREVATQLQIADQLPENPRKMMTAEAARQGVAGDRMRALKPAGASQNLSNQNISDKADGPNVPLPAEAKQTNVSVATVASPEVKGNKGAPHRVAVITEEPARPAKPFDVLATLAKIATDSAIKLSDDLRQIVQASPNQDSDKPKEKNRVVTVKPAVSAHNDFQFTVKPVLQVRAQPAGNKETPTVLAFPAPGVELNNHALKAASISTRLEIPRQLDQKIADAEGPYVKVVNGNGVTGMAGRISRYLERSGFAVGHAANADHFNHRHTVLYFPAGYLHEAWEVAKAIPGYQEMKRTVAVESGRARITLLIGRDVVQFRDMFHQG
jgi:tetratricopeptide (TPR) repeat protein